MKKNIIFVCTGNTCRSPMAEALFRNLLDLRIDLKEDFSVTSAGVYAYAGDPASSEAIRTMKEHFGINLASHRAKVLDDKDIREAWLILTMTQHHKEMILDIYPEASDKLYTLKEYAEYEGDCPDVCDPFGQDIKIYEQCAYEIEGLLQDILEKIS